MSICLFMRPERNTDIQLSIHSVGSQMIPGRGRGFKARLTSCGSTPECRPSGAFPENLQMCTDQDISVGTGLGWLRAPTGEQSCSVISVRPTDPMEEDYFSLFTGSCSFGYDPYLKTNR